MQESASTGIEVERARRDLKRIREYLSEGNLAAAAAAAEAASLRFQTLPASWYWRAMVDQLAGAHLAAILHVQQAIALDPERPEFFALLARSQMARHDIYLAVASAMRAAALSPEKVQVIEAVAQVLQLGGELDQALILIESALQQVPNRPSLLLAQANLLCTLNRRDDAAHAFESVLAVQPESGRAHWGLAQLGGWHAQCHHLERLEALAERLPEHSAKRCWMDYARYLEHEELGHDELAIAALQRGAASQRMLIDFAADRNARIFVRMKQLLLRWAPETDRVHAAAGVDAAPIPIFIVGMPRSGARLVEAMMGQNAEVRHAGDNRDFATCLQRVLGIQSESFLDEAIAARFDEIDFAAVARLYRDRLRERHGEAGMVTESLPANYIYAAAIARALPEARLLHVVREPMDNCFSLYRQMCAGVNPFSFDQEEMAQHYIAYEDWMRQLHAALPDRLLSVRYEHLVAAPVTVGRAMFRFCGLQWRDEYSDRTRHSKPLGLASLLPVEALHGRFMGRWRRYEHALQPMQRALAAAGLASPRMDEDALRREQRRRRSPSI